MKTIIEKIKEANLLGRGGAGFPTWIKWDAVQKAAGTKTYVIANGSEGEPAVFKDEYILKKYPRQFIGGIKIALSTFTNAEAVIFLNHTYYDKYKKILEKYSAGSRISYFRKTAHYIAGEETALISHIEGKRVEPRVKPPFPAQSGLYGCPTLINNIETYYRIFEIKNGLYSKKTFFSISGKVKKSGVYEFPLDTPVREVLQKTGNYPDFDFFVQYGGGAAGAIYQSKELDATLPGAASIVVYDRSTDPYVLMQNWANFFARENCDKCTPCREGSIRIREMIKSKKIDVKTINDIFFVLEKSSFCPLGRGMATPYKTLIEKVIKNEWF